MIQPPADGSETTNWHEVWRNSPEYQGVKKELSRLNALPVTQSADIDPMGGESSQHQEFVTSFSTQFWQVLIRTWKHFWRSPAYIWSKAILIVISVSSTFPNRTS